MKLIWIQLFIFAASLSAHADKSPGAYVKLQQMFAQATAPANADAVYTLIASSSGCAGASKENPDDIGPSELPTKVAYAKPGFGPNFPSTTLRGIGFDATTVPFDVHVDDEFFDSYKEAITPQGMTLHTLRWYDDQQCKTDDASDCTRITSAQEVDSVIRVTANTVIFQTGTWTAYCWQ